MSEPHNLLPEWNALPDACRDAMCRAVEFHGTDSQAALDVYIALRTHLPQQRFPLFEAPPIPDNARGDAPEAGTRTEPAAALATTAHSTNARTQEKAR